MANAMRETRSFTSFDVFGGFSAMFTKNLHTYTSLTIIIARVVKLTIIGVHVNINLTKVRKIGLQSQLPLERRAF